ncbi:MAG: RidA family protein [Desulfuromonadaceae bacterium]|nr:RidA family protein [Desulfuromonadaceae bacterium]
MKNAIQSPDAPAAIGPYSQAIDTGSLVFFSGQIPMDPSTGQLAGSTIEDQTRQVMQNMRAVLGAARLDFSHVVKTTIFLTDLAHFTTVNAIYGEHFSDPAPARACVQVAALPKDALIEIEWIAARP